ncbi:hypothetical protein [Cohaesibacter gelatinilyticus]|uniref:Uncharacterized protein n=1 Tax=Cohaesibacter gelatinilyticus TaxID=372072 RepID=A0A285PN44_9HYPH|nr:hypothetical protein [Cohaesibacter gelatinilyticus]SNZ21311.1 hypothetical protein SAMN06265368_4428 [Cohaesibacter gelatinilyticus]
MQFNQTGRPALPGFAFGLAQASLPHLPQYGQSNWLDQDLTPTFATNLDALMEDAPQDIQDGLEILPYQDRASIKPGGDHDYWSAQQGQNKVLIRYQGQSLSKAPGKVQDWLADNSAAYGLFLPVGSTAAGESSPEERITDGFDRVLVASLDSPSSRALGPSAKQMEEAVSAIDNPDLQEAARANLQINLDRQSKQDKAGQLNAARELWAAIDDGNTNAFVLGGTKSAGGEDINESFDLGDYGSLNVTGHGSAPAHTLTITAPDGSKTIITGRLEQDEKAQASYSPRNPIKAQKLNH